ncbi:MAG: sensor histidine kinase [Rubrivivax sp.]|nr:sensor histidine kinase [Rubrivivax sp.]
MDAQAPASGPAPARPFTRISLARQFLVASVLVLAAAVAATGYWVSQRIEASIVNRTASLAAAYFESILSRRLDKFMRDGELDSETRRMLDDIFVHGPLAQRVVRFKLWSPDGLIHYSSDHVQDGMKFPLHDHHAIALSGQMLAAISPLDGPDNAPERARWSRLIEIYVPLRPPGSSMVQAIAEFYHEVDTVEAEIVSAQRQSWVTIGLGAMLLFSILYALVLRASHTISGQQSELARQVQGLERLLAENRRINRRLQEAGARTTALGEMSLRRIAADLHDGPVQNMAFALLRADEPQAHAQSDAVRASLQEAMQQLRDIAAGLAAPSMAQLSLADALKRAVADASRHGGVAIDSDIDPGLPDAPLAVKFTAYRVAQEALSNAARHAPGHAPRLRACRDGETLLIEVADDGPGFDPGRAPADGHLGLAFLRERVQLLGGRVGIESAPGRGTTLRVRLPLAPEPPAGAAGPVDAAPDA